MALPDIFVFNWLFLCVTRVFFNNLCTFEACFKIINFCHALFFGIIKYFIMI